MVWIFFLESISQFKYFSIVLRQETLYFMHDKTKEIIYTSRAFLSALFFLNILS